MGGKIKKPWMTNFSLADCLVPHNFENKLELFVCTYYYILVFQKNRALVCGLRKAMTIRVTWCQFTSSTMW